MEDFLDFGGITGAANKSDLKIQDNYLFDSLIRAIDFFSQKFSLETLIDYAGDFINEVLTLGCSAQFVYDENNESFVLSKSRLYKTTIESVPDSKKLQDIAVLHGTIITGSFDSYFSKEFIDEYNPTLLIPLIHAKGLIGFIVTNGKAIGELDEDDFSMAKALMRLFNNAFDRNYYSKEFSQLKKQLDNTKFELFTINKTSKILFSEIDLSQLLTTGIEVFSEVSGSGITAFGIKDVEKNSLVVRAFKDSRRVSACPEDFHLYFRDNPRFQKDKYIFHVEDEMDALKEIFINPEVLSLLYAEYVVLIVKDKILGFVTLGKIKHPEEYEKDKLEVVNSLAISCFIALNNAIMFSELTAQKKDLEQRYSKLLSANE